MTMSRRHLSTKERDAIIYAWNSKCAYCKQVHNTFHIDHVVPHSKGGSCNLENLVPSCADCNQTKSDYLIPDEYIGIVLAKALNKKPKIENYLAETETIGKINMQVELLTLGQAAKLVNLSKPTLSKAVKDKKLKGKKVDGVFQIKRSELFKVYPSASNKRRYRNEESSSALSVENEYLKEQVADLKSRLANAKGKIEAYELRERNIFNTLASLFSGINDHEHS